MFKFNYIFIFSFVSKVELQVTNFYIPYTGLYNVFLYFLLLASFLRLENFLSFHRFILLGNHLSSFSYDLKFPSFQFIFIINQKLNSNITKRTFLYTSYFRLSLPLIISILLYSLYLSPWRSFIYLTIFFNFLQFNKICSFLDSLRKNYPHLFHTTLYLLMNSKTNS